VYVGILSKNKKGYSYKVKMNNLEKLPLGFRVYQIAIKMIFFVKYIQTT